eukprot:2852251-Amphidinium_carterae.1
MERVRAINRPQRLSEQPGGSTILGSSPSCVGVRGGLDLMLRRFDQLFPSLRAWSLMSILRFPQDAELLEHVQQRSVFACS